MTDGKQELFDLMANKQVELTISGEYGDVYGVLKVGSTRSRLKEVASTLGAQDWESALGELMDEYRRKSITLRPEPPEFTATV